MNADTVVRPGETSLRAWTVDAADFPAGGPISEALEFCVRYALLAPSSHNTQPWRFFIDASGVTIGLDVTRGLPVVDPYDREAHISVGTAALHLRVALSHFGLSTTTTFWPEPHDPEAGIRLDVVGVDREPQAGDELFDAITRRHTSHEAFTNQRIPQLVLDKLVAEAAAEGATLRLLADYPTRRALAKLVSEADRKQMDDKTFRRELATWLRPAHSHRGDGLRGYGSDLGELMSIAGPLMVRTFDLGDGRAARDKQLGTGSPVLGVLLTDTDDRSDWLRAGLALGRVLLRATAANVSVGFLDQPIEVDELRGRVATAVGTARVPQLLMRFGYGPPVSAQPRRRLEEVVERR